MQRLICERSIHSKNAYSFLQRHSCIAYSAARNIYFKMLKDQSDCPQFEMIDSRSVFGEIGYGIMCNKRAQGR